MGGSQASNSQPGFPSEAANLYDLLFENFPGAGGLGLVSNLFGSQGGFGGNQFSPFTAENIYGPQGFLAQNWGPLMSQGFGGGNALRQMGAQGTQQAFGNTSNLAGMQAQQAGQMGQFNPQDFLSAATGFSRGINQGLNAFGGAIGNAQTALSDVMNPTQYNSLFENAAGLLTPRVRAAFSARGLGSSGGAIEEEGNQMRQLSDSFALRQAQERQQALGTLGGLAQGMGGLGVSGAQVPGQVYNQLMQGGLMGQQGLAMAQQGQLGPLQALSMGGNVFNQGLEMGPSMFNNLMALRNQPFNMAIPLLGGISGANVSPAAFRSALGIPKG